MVKYTRRHYLEIGELLRDSSEEKQEKWIRTFRADNPRFDESRFRAYIKKDKIVGGR